MRPLDVIELVSEIPAVLIELATVTVPFRAVVDLPAIPIVIGVVPDTFEPMLIGPEVRVAVVELEPIFNIQDVCAGARLIVPVVAATALLIFVPVQSIEPQ